MITYIDGDITNIQYDGQAVIVVHIVNNKGLYGAGVSGNIARKWPIVETMYRAWFEGLLPVGEHRKVGDFDVYSEQFNLGSIQYVWVPFAEMTSICLVNMIAQDGVGVRYGQKPLHLPALRLCLEKVEFYHSILKKTIHMPRIGTGLGGGKWEDIEPLIERSFVEDNVLVYDWKRK